MNGKSFLLNDVNYVAINLFFLFKRCSVVIAKTLVQFLASPLGGVKVFLPVLPSLPTCTVEKIIY